MINKLFEVIFCPSTGTPGVSALKRQRKPGTPSTPTGGAGRGRKQVPAKTPVSAAPASTAAAPQIPTALPVSRVTKWLGFVYSCLQT